MVWEVMIEKVSEGTVAYSSRHNIFVNARGGAKKGRKKFSGKKR